MRVKEALVKAGRYQNVVDVITNIKTSSDFDFPLSHLYLDNSNQPKRRVAGEDVRRQASDLLEQIESDDVKSDSDFLELEELITDRLEIYMHNFANDAAHRIESAVDIDKIRIYSIIKSMFDNLIICNTDGIEFDIPDGWIVQ